MRRPATIMSGTLFIVATPIGNLEDVTLRALRVLREVAVIAAEDTRRTAKLLSHFGIHTPTTSYFEHNELEKLPRLLQRLSDGENIALVSDAGTPGISDPGYRLVKAAAAAGMRVEAVPGASAILTALVASGLPTNAFTFAGFPPARSQAREKWLASLAQRSETLIFFEAPHRVRATLEAARRVLGNREAMVGRELTKVHEDLVRGPITSVLERLGEPRGEFTIVLGPPEKDGGLLATIPPDARLFDEFCQLTEAPGVSRRDAVAELASRYGRPSREIYAALERAKGKGDAQQSQSPSESESRSRSESETESDS